MYKEFNRLLCVNLGFYAKNVYFFKADELVLLQNGSGWMERDKNVEKH